MPITILMRRFTMLLAITALFLAVVPLAHAGNADPWLETEFDGDPEAVFDGGWGLSSTSTGLEGNGALSRINRGAHWGSSYHWYPDAHGFGAVDELWLRYWVHFEEGFRIDSPYRVKLPGFGGLYTYNCLGNRWSTPSQPCWSARMTISPIYGNDGLPEGPYSSSTLRLGTYAYLLTDSDAGDPDRLLPWSGDTGLVEPGEWICVEQQAVMNTPGVSDGVIRGWVNGEPAFEKTDARMRRASESHIHVKSIWFDVYYGGSGTSPVDNRIVFDSMAVGPERTGCGIPEHVERIAGSDRYATSAAALSASSKASDRIFIASGETFPDAVVAGAAASQVPRDGLLLTAGGSLPRAIRSALVAQSPSEVVVVGGPAVISDRVLGEIAGALPEASVHRWSGDDRYNTAAAVSEGLFPDPESVSRVFVASGEAFPDALSAAPAAGMSSSPVLLTPADALAPAAREELVRLAPNEVVIVGGSAAVGRSVAAEIADSLPSAEILRISGADRTATSIALASFAFGSDFENLVVATGNDFPDALSAGPFAAALSSPVILVPTRNVPTEALDLAAQMYAVHGTDAQVFVIGGTSVVPNSVAVKFDPS